MHVYFSNSLWLFRAFLNELTYINGKNMFTVSNCTFSFISKEAVLSFHLTELCNWNGLSNFLNSNYFSCIWYHVSQWHFLWISNYISIKICYLISKYIQAHQQISMQIKFSKLCCYMFIIVLQTLVLYDAPRKIYIPFL